MEVISNAGLFSKALSLLPNVYVCTIPVNTFICNYLYCSFFTRSHPHLSVYPLLIFPGETTGTDLLARLLSLLFGFFGVRAWLNDIFTFVHPSSCVCGSESVLYPVTMKATYVLLCVGLLVLPATICQSPAERDSYTVSNPTISPCSFYHPLHD